MGRGRGSHGPRQPKALTDYGWEAAIYSRLLDNQTGGAPAPRHERVPVSVSVKMRRKYRPSAPPQAVLNNESGTEADNEEEFGDYAGEAQGAAGGEDVPEVQRQEVAAAAAAAAAHDEAAHQVFSSFDKMKIKFRRDGIKQTLNVRIINKSHQQNNN